MPMKVKVRIEPAKTTDGEPILALRTMQRLDTNVIYQLPLATHHRLTQRLAIYISGDQISSVSDLLMKLNLTLVL